MTSTRRLTSVVGFFTLFSLRIFADDGSLLKAIATIESSNRPEAIGDGGRARGLYQMHLAAVLDCGGTKSDWFALTNAAVAHKFAGLFLTKLTRQLSREGIQNPSPATLYMVWNCGWTGAKRLGFDVRRAPAATRRACKRIEGML